jgi:hypothetical protein
LSDAMRPTPQFSFSCMGSYRTLGWSALVLPDRSSRIRSVLYRRGPTAAVQLRSRRDDDGDDDEKAAATGRTEDEFRRRRVPPPPTAHRLCPSDEGEG